MPKIITLGLEKGGVLKSTATVNLAFGLANRGYKTLVIDFDQQRHAGLNLNPQGGSDLATVLKNKTLSLTDCSTTNNPNLLVLTNKSDINASLFNQFPVEDQSYLLQDALKNFDGVDFIIIDTPPNLELQTINSLIASDYLITPVPLEIFAISGLQTIINAYQKVKARFNPRLEYLGVVITKYNEVFKDNQEDIQSIVSIIKDKNLIFNSKIRTNISIPRSQKQLLTVYETQDKKGLADFENLTNEVLERLKIKN